MWKTPVSGVREATATSGRLLFTAGLAAWLASSAVALAAPGSFDGVGGSPPPHFGPDAAAGPPMPPPSPELLEEVRTREAEILAAVQEHDPDLYDRLIALKDSDPRAYLMQLIRVSRMGERFRSDPEFAQRMLRMRELDRQLHDLATAYRSEASDAQRKTLRENMEQITGNLFQLRQEERRARLEEMRTKLEELRAEIDQREKDREHIVDEYVDQLIDGPPDL